MSAHDKPAVAIRPETPADIEAITEITVAAFADHPISQQTEQFIIRALRNANAMSLSLVAELDGDVVGHIASSAVTFPDGSEGWEGLGPLSVSPEYQRRGIGAALMETCLARLQDGGAKGCVLVGDPNYYSRFGFASWPEVTHEGVPQEFVMLRAFGGDRPSGQVEFNKAFLATE